MIHTQNNAICSEVADAKNESVRLFKNDILEYFSHINPATPVVVFLPVILFFFYSGLAGVAPLAFVLLYVGGLFAWTLTEYVLHRFMFHHEFQSRIGKRVHFLLHGVHHDYPHDGTRLVMPLLVSVPLSVVFYFTFKLVFGTFNDAFFAGFVTGYLAYDCLHYAAHHFKMTSGIARFIKAYHLRHHFVNPNSGFGVSNPLWDYVFGTVADK